MLESGEEISNHGGMRQSHSALEEKQPADMLRRIGVKGDTLKL